ncbi:MAG TPA: histidine kinase dimerization/phospho-acceptor domain-containing protein [Gammaproteobacteria bacterium]|jgi:signal transduction histidine kinase|nr:histidine kinase dimerization/phospho-acceptor domain-containing protein [Gammaproteobacteria bacterium]
MMTKLNIEMDYLTLSHLLRIPLTEILGMTELLKHECLSTTQYEEVEAIKQAGNRLLIVVDKILKSQIEENIDLSIH